MNELWLSGAGRFLSVRASHRDWERGPELAWDRHGPVPRLEESMERSNRKRSQLLPRPRWPAMSDDQRVPLLVFLDSKDRTFLDRVRSCVNRLSHGIRIN